MRVRVRYFAAACELRGLREERLDLPGSVATVADVAAAIGAQCAPLSRLMSRMKLGVNGEIVDVNHRVYEADEIDVLPPVAGGSAREPWVAVRMQALSMDEATTAVTRPGAGGVCVFTGVVRDEADGKPVERLDYEAHEEMALLEMRRILVRIEAAHPGAWLAAIHRVGTLRVGDLAVVVAASAPHRAEAFDACRAAIEEIKATVPIWKKEWGPDGTAHWVNLVPLTGKF